MGKSKVFVIMPFKDEFFEVYEMLKMEFKNDFEFSNAGEEGNQQNILKDIIQPIFEADIVIADLTGLNPNVFYELGIAHTFNKKTIIITQDDMSILPFDLKQYKARDYTTNFKKFAELVEYLKINLKGAVDGNVIFSNPVKDFLSQKEIESNAWFSEKSGIVLEDEIDKGFLDFIADIEENIDALTGYIQNMTTEMKVMSDGVSKSNSEIERVNNNGGSGNASFIRKEAKKAAKYVEEFSIKLREHNKNFNVLWNKIEIDTFGLLENKFASMEDNKKGLVAYLNSLHGMKKTILESNTSIVNLKDSMHNNIGIERSMNQAIRFVEEDLSTYLTTTEQMNSSIDRILKKSKFVVGEIEFINTL